MNNLSLNKVVIFMLIFVLLTIIGTLSHEATHYLVSKLIGLDPQLHYGSVSFNDEINLSDKKSVNYLKFLSSTVAGPFQTILTGSIGFVFLIIKRNKLKFVFKTKDWLALFMSLFWLRPVFNLSKIIIIEFYNPELIVIGDEMFIAYHFNLPIYSINIVLGAIGVIISYVVVFDILPKRYILNLISGGFLGSIIGFILWFHFIGEIILP